MGLLASIVAYLSVVAAIVTGFMLSVDALRNHSHQVTEPRPEITVAAKAYSPKTKKAARQPGNAAELRAIPRRSMATDFHRKTDLSNRGGHEAHKRTEHEAQRRYAPSDREHAGAPRLFGYAQEPRFSGY